MAKRTPKKPCKDCAWSFANTCLAFPYKSEKMGEIYKKKLDRSFLSILKKKSELRKRIFQNDEKLKLFLNLWQNHRSSEIILKDLL